MRLRASLGRIEPALGVLELCAQCLAFLAGPIDFAIGPVFNVTGVTLLNESDPVMLD